MGRQTLISTVVVLWAVGCGGDDTGGMSDGGVHQDGASGCPMLSGTWTIASHCNSALVGMEVIVMQTSCSLTTNGTFAGFSGTVAHDGSLSIAGTVSGTSVMCTGNATAQHWTQNCTGNCAVTLTH